ncbi:putative cytochrome P450 [Metapseudomonas resinovorans NBRC 106553]|uniref:Putative cytochrome P450 n=2 Tax=Metapseudomonas resinovorans TaxID=53412 RepID=S6AF90_METRE|nr:putative cytochrome P450 [Pseudomonas resinovorans NBRC 106553]
MTAPLSELPDHVPADLVRHFDLYEPIEGDDDYQTWFTKLQAAGTPDIFWTRHNGGHWVVTRGEDFDHVLKTPETYSSRINVVPRERLMPIVSKPIQLDPPDHTRYRNLLIPAFSPKAVVPLGEKARALTIELIEGSLARGRCEFVSEFARRLPIGIFMDMVALPTADREQLLEWVDEMIRPTQVDSLEAGNQLIRYAFDQLQERRAEPGSDLLSELTRAQVGGNPLQDEELVGMFFLLLLGGLDTVAAMLSFIIRHLASHPEARRELIEHPERIPAAAEELMRRFPISTLVRVVTRDHEYKGINFREGDLVLMQTSAHSVDDRLFNDPLAVDFERKVVFHGTFGSGAHRCIGSMLARVEVRVFLEEWLKRIPEFRLKPGQPLRVEPGMVLAMPRLELEWDITESRP